MIDIKNYLSLIKFSHTIFALPFAFIGFFLASTIYEFDFLLLILVLICMISARSAAMAFNRYIDRDIDLLNPRTAQVREIPNGTISAKSALIFVVISSLIFVSTTYFINPLCFALSPIALIVILGYSLTKRFTALCHLILGLGLSLSPIGAYLAVSSSFDLTPILFSCIVLSWVAGFDIVYALQDESFDKKNKLYSIPVKFGAKKALLLSKTLHLISSLTIIYIGHINSFNVFYWIGTAIFIVLLIYQHSIIKYDDFSKINIAFFTTNGIASILFAIFTIIDLLIYR